MLQSDNTKYIAAKINIKACNYQTALNIAKAIFDRAGYSNSIEVKRRFF